MRLRTLSEAECYARCYGGRGEERVSFVRTVRTTATRPTTSGERLRQLFEQRLAARDEREAA